MTLLGVVTTVLVSRIGMAVNALLLPERRSRELTALFALALLVIAFPVAVFLGSLRWDGLVPDSLRRCRRCSGSVRSPRRLPSSSRPLQEGRASAWVSGIVAVLTVGLLWVAWSWLVRRLLTTTERPVTSRERTGLGWFGLLPSNAFGAIAARSLVYWLRDRRYIMNIIVVPVAGVLDGASSHRRGRARRGRRPGARPGDGAVLRLAAAQRRRLRLDGSVDTRGERGARASRSPRSPGSGSAGGCSRPRDRHAAVAPPHRRLEPPAAARGACGESAVLGARHLEHRLGRGPVRGLRPGDSPFSSRSGPAREARTARRPLSSERSWSCIPTAWLFAATVLEGSAYAPATFWVGLLVGLAVLAAGAVIGGRIFERSGERLMEFVETA